MIDRGHIDLMISEEDLEDLDFNDRLPCYRQTTTIERYYNKHNSSVWQMLDESPAWIHALADQIPRDFQHFVVSVIKNDPGQTIPYHVDLHTMLRNRYGDGPTWRYLIFLQDWKLGHYFEILGEPVVKWRAGDWIKFQRSDWHLGGNMGLEPFYSAQITVI